MSAIKEANHENINDNEAQLLDADYQYLNYLDKQSLTDLEEREEFFKIFNLSGTYPM